MRRIVSLWLPTFATDRLTRPRGVLPDWRERPLATVTAAQGGLRIVAANGAARAGGVSFGMVAASARAVCPGLKTIEQQPAADLAALTRLADWCQRFTPWIAVDGLEDAGNAGLWLDISGCAHLFGGEAALLDDLAVRVEALGFQARAAVADTTGAAWAAARFATERTTVVPEGAARQLLARLPVAALRLPPAAVDLLNRLGLRRIGDLFALPRAPLAARFGEVVARRLDQLTGALPESISPRRPVSPHHVRLAFAEAIGRTEDMAAALRRLLERLCARLEREGLGARRLHLALFRVDGSDHRIDIGTARPVREPAHLARLFAEELNGLDAGFGIECMTLAAPAVDPLSATQTDWRTPAGRRADSAGDVALLVDRLGVRLGSGNVFRLARRASHLPERAARPAPPLGPLDDRPPPRPAPRPLRLLDRPHPIAETADESLPAAFRWRGGLHRLTRADGPERIATEWWHGAAPPSPEALRDYWRVEDTQGRRYWIFRQGMERPARWYLHGVFS